MKFRSKKEKKEICTEPKIERFICSAVSDCQKEFEMMRKTIFDEFCENHYVSLDIYKEIKKTAYSYFMSITSLDIVNTYINHEIAIRACIAMALQNKPKEEKNKK